jgi:hypothetical protein
MWKWNWKTASEEDVRLFRAVSVALDKHPKLIEFLFAPDRPGLSSEPEELLEYSRNFSSGEQVLVAIGLDIWSQSGNAVLWKIIHKLDVENFSNVMKSLQYLMSNQGYEKSKESQTWITILN